MPWVLRATLYYLNSKEWVPCRQTTRPYYSTRGELWPRFPFQLQNPYWSFFRLIMTRSFHFQQSEKTQLNYETENKLLEIITSSNNSLTFSWKLSNENLDLISHCNCNKLKQIGKRAPCKENWVKQILTKQIILRKQLSLQKAPFKGKSVF